MAQKTTNLEYLRIIEELESKSIMPEKEPSIEPTRRALNELIHPSLIRPNQTIVVAGTNGKGSVCATLEALFLSTGKQVGLYTSPHLEETTERIRINGKDISPELFCTAYKKVQERTSSQKLTHFETLTLMAAWVFYSGEAISPVDIAVFEVGLGGTWDATNAIPHHFNVITSLDYDHQNLLGHSLTEIARNKFGIISKDSVVVHSPFPQEVLPLSKEVQATTHSKWVETASYQWSVEPSEQPQFQITTSWGTAEIQLPGPRGALNTATALTLFNEMGNSPQNHLHSLKNVRWPGRMEKINSRLSLCPIYLSGDHNPAGVKSLIELLPYYRRNHLYILAGIGKDKDMNEILPQLSSLPQSSLYLTETPFRGLELNQYGNWAEKAKGMHKNPVEALKMITSLAQEDDLILVTGSLYLVGYLRKFLSD